MLDLSAVKEMHFAHRTLITVDQMHHSDFTSFAVVGYDFGMENTYKPAPGEHRWNRETAFRGYINVCGLVLDFLDETLNQDATGAKRLRADLKLAADGTLEHWSASDVPPTPLELLGIAREKGFDAAAAIIEKAHKSMPVDWVVNESAFNSLGYNMLGAEKVADAVMAFRLNTLAHPQSSNAFDSLADGYMAAGEKQKAVEAYQHAIAAAAKDPALTEVNRKSFIADEKSKVEKLRKP